MTATFEDFQKIDVRVGKIIEVRDFPEARKPAYQLTIDFGPEVGILHSSAQFVNNHSKTELQGKLVLGVVNFPPLQVGPFRSECLTLGVPDQEGNWIYITPSHDQAVIGGRMS